MKQIILDIGYRLRRFPFWIAVCLSAMVFYQGMLSENEGDVLYFYIVSISFGTFLVLAPCIAAMPCAVSICREMRGGLASYHIHRCGVGRYLRNRATSCIITGGLALMLGPLLVCAGLLTKYPIAGEYMRGAYHYGDNTSFSSLLIRNQYMLFLGMKLVLLFLHGASSAMVCFAASAYSANIFVALFTPFILFRAYDIFIGFEFNYLYSVSALVTGYVYDVPFSDTWGFLGYAISVQVVVWLLAWGIAYFGFRRQLKNA